MLLKTRGYGVIYCTLTITSFLLIHFCYRFGSPLKSTIFVRSVNSAVRLGLLQHRAWVLILFTECDRLICSRSFNTWHLLLLLVSKPPRHQVQFPELLFASGLFFFYHTFAFVVSEQLCCFHLSHWRSHWALRTEASVVDRICVTLTLISPHLIRDH